MMWILDAVEKKSGSGTRPFAIRVAEEVKGIVEGKSAIWDRRGAVHKLGTAARVNLGWRARRR